MEEKSSIKNYVSLLNEILSKKKLLPDYKVVENGTGSNKTKFTMQLEVDGKTTVGTGRSKKEAKIVCAREMYEIFKKESLLPPPKNAALDDNPVGYLYQFSQLSGWPAPKFDIISEHGPQHDKTFTVSCKLHEHTTEGQGLSLKQARQSAASHMIPLLKTCDLSKIKFEEEKVEKHSTDASESTSNGSESIKRPINSQENASKPKKRKSDNHSKEDINFSRDIILSNFSYLSVEKKEELKTQIKKLVDSFMDEYFKKLFTCSTVIQFLEEKNRITDIPKIIYPYESLYKYFIKEPFVNKSEIINTNKEIDVDNIDHPKDLFETIIEAYDITYSFKQVKSENKRIVVLILKTDAQQWTFMGFGIDAEIIAMKQALKFLIVMSRNDILGV